ncbi:MAG: hypothetical protein P8Y04_12870 [Desulfobulbaceae bacterium]
MKSIAAGAIGKLAEAATCSPVRDDSIAAVAVSSKSPKPLI